MKKLRILLCLALAAVLCLGLAACGETAEEPSGGYKVTFYDSDGVTVLAETTAEEGQPVADPGLTKEGLRHPGLLLHPRPAHPLRHVGPRHGGQPRSLWPGSPPS